INEGITSLPCIGDGRQSGTSASPSILNCSPEAAAPGAVLALLRTGARESPRAARGGRRVRVPGQPAAVAGDQPVDDEPAGRRHGAGASCRLPAHRADEADPAPQSLTRLKL